MFWSEHLDGRAMVSIDGQVDEWTAR